MFDRSQKFLTILISIFLMLSLLAGCQNAADNSSSEEVSSSVFASAASSSQTVSSSAVVSSSSAAASSMASSSSVAASASSTVSSSVAASSAASSSQAAASSVSSSAPAPASSSVTEVSSSAAASSKAAAPAGLAPADYPPVPWPSGEFDSGAEDEIISLINDLRASQGLSALAYDANLNACARIRCAEMAATDVFAHTRPDGRPWQTVLTENGIKYATAAENLAWREGGGVSASQLYKQWEASSGHYANMVRGNVKYVGVGVLVSDGQIWACTLFSA